jgi:predicted ArsR family transcriptional regulator
MPSGPQRSPGAEVLAARLARIVALGDPTRAALYAYVASRRAPVSRDEAAAALTVPRHVAKFHLDRLVEAGLLATEYHRPPGRSGPGAGRPAKHYRLSGELAVSVPERHYDMAGELLARAITEAGDAAGPVVEELGRLTHATGLAIGARHRAGRSRPAAALAQVLAELGYQPRRERGALVLDNCPFHHLAATATDLVCGMNLELIRGVVEGLGGSGLRPALEPTPGACCVRIHTGRRAGAGR